MINILLSPNTTHPNSPGDDNAWNENPLNSYGGSSGSNQGSFNAPTTHYFAGTARVTHITFIAATGIRY